MFILTCSLQRLQPNLFTFWWRLSKASEAAPSFHVINPLCSGGAIRVRSRRVCVELVFEQRQLL